MTNFVKGCIPWNKGLKGWNGGEKHYHWKGGKRISSQGYIEIKSPNHPFTNKQGYVPKHRLVVEKYLGRFLKRDEIIHHINEDPKDNRISNLYLFGKRWQHCVYHRFVKRGKVKRISHSNIIKSDCIPDAGASLC